MLPDLDRTANAGETTPLSADSPERFQLLPVSFLSLAVAWALLFVAIVATTDLANSFSSDDGAYVLGVEAQRDGDRALDRAIDVVSGDHETIINGIYTSDGPVPYVRHPAYLALLRTTSNAFGLVWGSHLPALVGLLLFPFAVRSVAREVDPDIADLAFALAAVSPVLVNGLAIWAHAPSAVLGALSLRYALRLMSPRDGSAGARAIDASGLAVLLALGILVRAEALLWAAAVLIAIVIIGRSARHIAYAAIVGVPAVAVFAFERSVKSRLAEEPIAIVFPAVPARQSWLAGRPGATWHEVFSTSSQPTIAGMVSLVALVLAGYGALVWRRSDRDPTVFLVAAAGLYALRLALVQTELATGFVAAWPIGLVLLIAGGRRLEQRGQLLATAGVLFAGAVLLTQHANGSGTGWGGRYLTLLIPVVAVLAAQAGASLIHHDGRLQSARYVAVLALAVLPVASGLRATAESRSIHASSIAFMTQDDPDVVVTEYVAFGRLGWHATVADGVDWYRADDDNLGALLADLSNAGVDRVAVQGFVDSSVDLDGYRTTAVTDQLRTLDRIE